jgi:heptosyltransferase I
VKSIVLVRLSAMGDLVQSVGAVASLRAVNPDWQVTFVTQQEWAPLLDGVAGIDHVVRFDRHGGLGSLRKVRSTLRSMQFDYALDLQGNWKSALVTRLAGACEHFGMDRDWRQEPWSRVLLRQRVSCQATPHPARAAWELVKQVAPSAPFFHGRLIATPAEIADEKLALISLGIDCERPFSVVVVTDPSDPRALRPAMTSALALRDRPTVMLLGPGEVGVPSPEGCVIRHRRGEVRRLVALGALVQSAGGDVIGPDQGATHVMVAAGAASDVYFGSQDPHRTSPPMARAFVRAGELSCRPCRARSCSNADGVQCMELDYGSGVLVESLLPPVGATGAGPWSDLL